MVDSRVKGELMPENNRFIPPNPNIFGRRKLKRDSICTRLSHDLNPVGKAGEFLRDNHRLFIIRKIRFQMGMEARAIRHSNDIDIFILQSSDYISNAEKRSRNNIIG